MNRKTAFLQILVIVGAFTIGYSNAQLKSRVDSTDAQISTLQFLCPHRENPFEPYRNRFNAAEVSADWTLHYFRPHPTKCLVRASFEEFNTEAIKLLCAYKRTNILRYAGGRSLLQQVACFGSDEAIKVLVASGEDPNYKDPHLLTPLDLASLSEADGQARSRLLIAYGADPSKSFFRERIADLMSEK